MLESRELVGCRQHFEFHEELVAHWQQEGESCVKRMASEERSETCAASLLIDLGVREDRRKLLLWSIPERR